MELRQLRYFIHVAEEEHVGRAARKLHITQSPLSRQIRDLERDLGVLLFERRKGRLRLTAAGRALLDEARPIMRQVERARSAVVRAGRGEPQHLGIAVVETAIASGVVLAGLRTLCRRLPDVSLSLRVANPEEQLRLLMSAHIDAGVLPDIGLQDSDLATLRLHSESIVLALSVDDARSLAPDLALGDLSDARWIGLQRSLWPHLHDVSMRICRESGFTPRYRHTAGGVLALLGLVAIGAGVALLNESARAWAPSGVVLRTLPGLEGALETHLAWYRDNRSTPLRALVDVLKEVDRRPP
jgi:DNA-binding transcriptional LysR family regulator